jgi:hypothetical protein
VRPSDDDQGSGDKLKASDDLLMRKMDEREKEIERERERETMMIMMNDE